MIYTITDLSSKRVTFSCQIYKILPYCIWITTMLETSSTLDAKIILDNPPRVALHSLLHIHSGDKCEHDIITASPFN